MLAYLTYKFKLRQGVKLNDGTQFAAEDVKYFVERVPIIKDSAIAFTTDTKTVALIEVVDPVTLLFKMSKPYPLMPNDLSIIPFVSEQTATNACSADFNAGKAAIGAAPYKFSRYATSDRLKLTKNGNIWGKKPAWPSVTFRILNNDVSCAVALLRFWRAMCKLSMAYPFDLAKILQILWLHLILHSRFSSCILRVIVLRPMPSLWAASIRRPRVLVSAV